MNTLLWWRAIPTLISSNAILAVNPVFPSVHLPFVRRLDDLGPPPAVDTCNAQHPKYPPQPCGHRGRCEVSGSQKTGDTPPSSALWKHPQGKLKPTESILFIMFSLRISLW